MNCTAYDFSVDAIRLPAAASPPAASPSAVQGDEVRTGERAPGSPDPAATQVAPTDEQARHNPGRFPKKSESPEEPGKPAIPENPEIQDRPEGAPAPGGDDRPTPATTLQVLSDEEDTSTEGLFPPRLRLPYYLPLLAGPPGSQDWSEYIVGLSLQGTDRLSRHLYAFEIERASGSDRLSVGLAYGNDQLAPWFWSLSGSGGSIAEVATGSRGSAPGGRSGRRGFSWDSRRVTGPRSPPRARHRCRSDWWVPAWASITSPAMGACTQEPAADWGSRLRRPHSPPRCPARPTSETCASKRTSSFPCPGWSANCFSFVRWDACSRERPCNRLTRL